MKLKFCGAAKTVTGSAHLIELEDGFKILLDCGLYQGREEAMKSFNDTWLFDPKELDCVILSHAHIDHSGRLPKLVKDGFKGTIYSTHATRSLCTIMLLDSAKIQERDAEYSMRKQKAKKGRVMEEEEPLYTAEDVQHTMGHFVSIGYEKWFPVRNDVEVLFRDAGHILGSASITLHIKEKERTVRIGFTGDVGRPDRPILRDPKPMPPVDYLISESTYGNRDHEGKPAEEERFLKIIKHTCVEKAGKLIIPAFSVGRTQEIVYLLDQMETAGKLPHIPVYVDSPLAVNATTIFASHPECYDSQLTEYLLSDPNPFGFNDLHYINATEDSKKLNTMEDPCIIISSSGMANAGRIRHHLFNSIDQARNTVLIVGYCTPDTPGGMLRNGVNALKFFGEWKMVHAEVEVMDSFSAHADRNELLDFLQSELQTLKKLFLVHGEEPAQEGFKALLEQHAFTKVVTPELGESYEI
ncbi:MAG: MBL fold metallo-hydrolase [Saprospirales bacterium]|nr:MBL fold metallo-hydrolase [Saprospirales bacterium]MBK8493087.1 MBL fold metallo-hydrolase [Saprospirales bacterium]